MAMTMSGEYLLAAPREEVWKKLNDPAVLKACIPGCEDLDMVSDTEFVVVAKNKIGPVSARFKGRVTLSAGQVVKVVVPCGVLMIAPFALP